MTAAIARHMVVHWRDLQRWDIKTARASLFRLAHPGFRLLGDFAEEATEIVRPWEAPETEWPVYGVNNEAGVVFSHHQRGDSFNAPYKRIRKDWFFHNPTRANVGSLGRVPEVPADAITSPEYQVWRITGDLLPAYVAILIHTPYFVGQIACHRVGAVKERLFVQNLLEIPIPVLPRDAQRKIVAVWEASRKAAAATAAKISQLEADIEADFLADLGLKAPAQTKLPKCFSVRWRDFLRWSVSNNQLAEAGMDLSGSQYPLATIGSIAAMIQYGTSVKANASGDGTPVIRMNNLVDGLLDLSNLKHLRLSAAELARLDLVDGDILFNRTNSKELVGKCAVFHEDGHYVFASYLIRVRMDTSRAHPDYITYALNSPIGRQQIDAMSRQIIGQANINSEELRSLQVPLPPLYVQRQLAESVARRRDEIAKLKAEAKAAANAAKAEVEAMILGIKSCDVLEAEASAKAASVKNGALPDPQQFAPGTA